MAVLVMVLTAFASGAMAAAMGAMPSVILCGLAVCIGSVGLAGGRVDTVAVAIVILSMAGRVLFGGIGLRGIVGRVPEGKKRFCVTCCDCWLGHQSCASGHQLFLLGAVIGCFSGYMVKLILDLAASTGNAALSAIAPLPVWGFAIVGCVFIACGKTMPVWHHIALIAGYAVNMAYLGGGRGESCILWGVAFGVVAAYAGDLLAKLFSVYGEGYVDPPSMVVAAASVFLLGVFPALGFDNPASLFYWLIPIAALAVAAVLADVWRRKRKAVNP